MIHHIQLLALYDVSLWPGSGKSAAPHHTSPGLWRELEGLSASDRGRGSAVDREIGPRGLAKQTCEQEAALLCREKIEGRKAPGCEAGVGVAS